MFQFLVTRVLVCKGYTLLSWVHVHAFRQWSLSCDDGKAATEHFLNYLCLKLNKCTCPVAHEQLCDQFTKARTIIHVMGKEDRTDTSGNAFLSL